MQDYNQAIVAYTKAIGKDVPLVMRPAHAIQATRTALTFLPTEMVGRIVGFAFGVDDGLRQHITAFAPVLYRLAHRGAYSLNYSTLGGNHYEFWQHKIVWNEECNRHCDKTYDVIICGCNCKRCGGYKAVFAAAWSRPSAPIRVQCRCL